MKKAPYPYLIPFLFGVLSPLLVCEPWIRLFRHNLYQRFEHQLAQDPVHLILVGSSRVAAAIDAQILAQDLSHSFGQTIRVTNLGRGYSTPHDKFILFRELFARYPEKVKNSWLLIEAPQGLPDEATWSSSWARKQEPGLIAPYIQIRDLIRMLKESDTPASLVGEIGFYHFSRTALLLRKLRDALDVQTEAWSSYGLNLFFPESNTVPPVSSLTTTGGILNTPEVIQTTRQSIRPSPVSSAEWQNTVWSSVFQLAREYGLKVAFFEPPMSRVDAQNYRESTQSNKPRKQELLALGIPTLPCEIVFPDSNFPDLLHLTPEKSTEFTHYFGLEFFGAFPHAF